jgi:hypothetical protein
MSSWPTATRVGVERVVSGHRLAAARPQLVRVSLHLGDQVAKAGRGVGERPGIHHGCDCVVDAAALQR